jgi:hypothetical protein
MQTDLDTTKKSLKSLTHSHNFIPVLFSLIILLGIQALIETHLSKSSDYYHRMDVARSITR